MVGLDLETIHTWSLWAGIAAAAAVLWFAPRRGSRMGVRRSAALAAAMLIAFAIVWPKGLGRVQPGARGVVLRFGAPTGEAKPEGLYYVLPFADTVAQVNTQINVVGFDRAQATTKDLEPVYVDMLVDFHVNPSRVVDVYRALRSDYAERIIVPSTQEVLKSVAAQYAATELIALRPRVQRDLTLRLRERLATFGLVLDALSTTRLNFSYAYAQAAENRVASSQRTLQAEADLQRVRFEAQQNVIRAESEIKALRLQKSVGTEQLLRLRELDNERRAIEKWDGHLPQTTTALPFLPKALAPPA